MLQFCRVQLNSNWFDTAEVYDIWITCRISATSSTFCVELVQKCGTISNFDVWISCHSLVKLQFKKYNVWIWPNAPVKVTAPPPTQAIAGSCGDLNLISLDVDPHGDGKCAKIHDLRRRDRGLRGEFTIRWSAVPFSRHMLHLLTW